MIVRRIGRPAWDFRNAFEEIERMRRRMDLLMGDPWGEGVMRSALREPWAGVFPLMNITEDRNHFFLRAELPGIQADSLDINVTGKTLSISGERKIAAEGDNVKYHRREREAGTFSRVVTLPDQVDTDKVEARSIDGVLTVILPKSEAAKPKQITVK